MADKEKRGARAGCFGAAAALPGLPRPRRALPLLALAAVAALFLLRPLAGWLFPANRGTKAGRALWARAARRMERACSAEYPRLRARLLADPRFELANVSAFSTTAPSVRSLRPAPGPPADFPFAAQAFTGEFRMWTYAARHGHHDHVSVAAQRDGVWEKDASDAVVAAFGVSPPLALGRNIDPFQHPDIEDPDGTPRALLDVGCNLGWFSLLLASRGVRAICVEPMPANAALATASVCENGLQGRVHVIVAAVSDVGGASCAIEADLANVGDGKLVCGPSAGGGTPSRELPPLANVLFPALAPPVFQAVPVTTLSTILPPPSSVYPRGVRIRAAKFDVEGFEELALMGSPWQRDPAQRPRLVVAEADPDLLARASRFASRQNGECCSAGSLAGRLKAMGYVLMRTKDHGEDGPRYRPLGEGEVEGWGQGRNLFAELNASAIPWP
ncbi:S-adenosyl-L-methionine-dependent methyltransferase [Hyaloraphidium curvatum]|nr:S-adenosyl-L-methionine-dependent methyltransferase [Hyaloraphidium curvatum]